MQNKSRTLCLQRDIIRGMFADSHKLQINKHIADIALQFESNDNTSNKYLRYYNYNYKYGLVPESGNNLTSTSDILKYIVNSSNFQEIWDHFLKCA